MYGDPRCRLPMPPFLPRGSSLQPNHFLPQDRGDSQPRREDGLVTQDRFQWFGLHDGQTGCPPCLSSEDQDTMVAYPFAQFHAGEPASTARLALFLLEQFHVPIISEISEKSCLVINDSNQSSASCRNSTAFTTRGERDFNGR
jgi:hypothetical protein